MKQLDIFDYAKLPKEEIKVFRAVRLKELGGLCSVIGKEAGEHQRQTALRTDSPCTGMLGLLAGQTGAVVLDPCMPTMSGPYILPSSVCICRSSNAVPMNQIPKQHIFFLKHKSDQT